jgi:hypothetical protein
MTILMSKTPYVYRNNAFFTQGFTGEPRKAGKNQAGAQSLHSRSAKNIKQSIKTTVFLILLANK